MEQSLATSESSVANVTLIDPAVLAALPGPDLGRRAIELNTGVGTHFVIAARAGAVALRYAIALGQVLEHASTRFRGEYGTWLKMALGDSLSEDTARNYRLIFRKRESLFPENGEPQCRCLTDAYIKLGIIPAPVRGEASDMLQPLFRLNFVAQDDVARWPQEKRQEFLDRTKPILDMRSRIIALGGVKA